MVEKIPLNWLNPKRQIFPFLVMGKFDLTIFDLSLVLTFKNTFSLILNFFFNHIVTKIIVQSRSQKKNQNFIFALYSLSFYVTCFCVFLSRIFAKHSFAGVTLLRIWLNTALFCLYFPCTRRCYAYALS